MAAPQSAAQRSRWYDLCLAAAAGSALATGAALYWRHRSSATRSCHCSCGANRDSQAAADAAVVPEHTTADRPAPAPDQQRQLYQQDPQQEQPQQPQEQQQLHEQQLLRQSSETWDRCRHDSAQSVDTSALALWQQAARDGWQAQEGAADSGGTSKSASSGGGAVGSGHDTRSPAAMATSAAAASAMLPGHVVDTATPRDSMDSLGAPTTRAPSTNLDMRDIRLYREPDGRPVLLGRGSHAKVYKGQLNGEDVAVKVWALEHGMGDQSAANFRAEVLLLRMCRDRNVVGFRGASVTAKRMLMVMELCPGGDLRKALREDTSGRLLWYARRSSTDGGRQEGEGRKIALDIARGLAFLHQMQLIHFDVKSPNVLLAADGSAKIGDVGMARYMPRDYLTSNTAAGTLAWAAPELLLGERCSQRADVYSLGVVLWELCTGESPAGRRLRALSVPDDCPAAVRDIVSQCLERDPALRPRAAEVAALLGGDPAQLQAPLPPRQQPAFGPEAGAQELEVCALHRALAAEVYGSEDDARAAGCMPLDPDTALAAMDLRLFCRYMAGLRAVLRDPAEHAPLAPAALQRVQRLVGAWRAYILPFLRLRTRIIVRNRLTNLEAGGGSAPGSTRTDSADSVAQAAAAAAAGTGGSDSRADAAAQLPSVRSDSAVQEAARLQQRMHRVIAAVGFRPEQRAAFLQERRRTVEALERNRAERARLVDALQRLAKGGGGGYSEAVSASAALKANAEARTVIANGFQMWFTCELLSLEQQGRLELAIMPQPPDAISIGEAMEAQDRGVQ